MHFDSTKYRYSVSWNPNWQLPSQPEGYRKLYWGQTNQNLLPIISWKPFYFNQLLLIKNIWVDGCCLYGLRDFRYWKKDIRMSFVLGKHTTVYVKSDHLIQTVGSLIFSGKLKGSRGVQGDQSLMNTTKTKVDTQKV